MMDIFLIDAIGPFFRNYRKRRINWSKIPFHHFDTDPAIRKKQFAAIRTDLDIFAGKESKIGYNSVSFDDVAHLAPDPWLEPEINNSISSYQEEYRTLFSICSGHGLAIYLTMDVLSLTPALKMKIARSRRKARQFLMREIKTDFSPFLLRSRHLGWLLHISLRNKRGYRVLD